MQLSCNSLRKDDQSSQPSVTIAPEFNGDNGGRRPALVDKVERSVRLANVRAKVKALSGKKLGAFDAITDLIAEASLNKASLMDVRRAPLEIVKLLSLPHAQRRATTYRDLCELGRNLALPFQGGSDRRQLYVWYHCVQRLKLLEVEAGAVLAEEGQLGEAAHWLLSGTLEEFKTPSPTPRTPHTPHTPAPAPHTPQQAPPPLTASDPSTPPTDESNSGDSIPPFAPSPSSPPLRNPNTHAISTPPHSSTAQTHRAILPSHYGTVPHHPRLSSPGPPDKTLPRLQTHPHPAGPHAGSDREVLSAPQSPTPPPVVPRGPGRRVEVFELIGQEALQGNMCGATVEATSPCQLASLSRSDYQAVMALAAKESFEGLRVMSSLLTNKSNRHPKTLSDLASLMSVTDMFRSMDPEFRTELCGQLEFLALPEGTVLFEEGDKVDFNYVILKGEVILSRFNESRNMWEDFATRTSGQQFGTLPALTPQAAVSGAGPGAGPGGTAAGGTAGEGGVAINDKKRSYTARCSQLTEFAIVTKVGYNRLIRSQLQKSLNARLKVLQGMAIMSAAAHNQALLTRIATNCQDETFSPGAILLDPVCPPTRFFFVVDGQAKLMWVAEQPGQLPPPLDRPIERSSGPPTSSSGGYSFSGTAGPGRAGSCTSADGTGAFVSGSPSMNGTKGLKRRQQSYVYELALLSRGDIVNGMVLHGRCSCFTVVAATTVKVMSIEVSGGVVALEQVFGREQATMLRELALRQAELHRERAAHMVTVRQTSAALMDSRYITPPPLAESSTFLQHYVPFTPGAEALPSATAHVPGYAAAVADASLFVPGAIQHGDVMKLVAAAGQSVLDTLPPPRRAAAAALAGALGPILAGSPTFHNHLTQQQQQSLSGQQQGLQGAGGSQQQLSYTDNSVSPSPPPRSHPQHHVTTVLAQRMPLPRTRMRVPDPGMARELGLDAPPPLTQAPNGEASSHLSPLPDPASRKTRNGKPRAPQRTRLGLPFAGNVAMLVLENHSELVKVVPPSPAGADTVAGLRQAISESYCDDDEESDEPMEPRSASGSSSIAAAMAAMVIPVASPKAAVAPIALSPAPRRSGPSQTGEGRWRRSSVGGGGARKESSGEGGGARKESSGEGASDGGDAGPTWGEGATQGGSDRQGRASGLQGQPSPPAQPGMVAPPPPDAASLRSSGDGNVSAGYDSPLYGSSEAISPRPTDPSEEADECTTTDSMTDGGLATYRRQRHEAHEEHQQQRRVSMSIWGHSAEASMNSSPSPSPEPAIYTAMDSVNGTASACGVSGSIGDVAFFSQESSLRQPRSAVISRSCQMLLGQPSELLHVEPLTLAATASVQQLAASLSAAGGLSPVMTTVTGAAAVTAAAGGLRWSASGTTAKRSATTLGSAATPLVAGQTHVPPTNPYRRTVAVGGSSGTAGAMPSPVLAATALVQPASSAQTAKLCSSRLTTIMSPGPLAGEAGASAPTAMPPATSSPSPLNFPMALSSSPSLPPSTSSSMFGSEHSLYAAFLHPHLHPPAHYHPHPHPVLHPRVSHHQHTLQQPSPSPIEPSLASTAATGAIRVSDGGSAAAVSLSSPSLVRDQMDSLAAAAAANPDNVVILPRMLFYEGAVAEVAGIVTSSGGGGGGGTSPSRAASSRVTGGSFTSTSTTAHGQSALSPSTSSPAEPGSAPQHNSPQLPPVQIRGTGPSAATASSLSGGHSTSTILPSLPSRSMGGASAGGTADDGRRAQARLARSMDVAPTYHFGIPKERLSVHTAVSRRSLAHAESSGDGPERHMIFTGGIGGRSLRVGGASAGGVASRPGAGGVIRRPHFTVSLRDLAGVGGLVAARHGAEGHAGRDLMQKPEGPELPLELDTEAPPLQNRKLSEPSLEDLKYILGRWSKKWSQQRMHFIPTSSGQGSQAKGDSESPFTASLAQQLSCHPSASAMSERHLASAPATPAPAPDSYPADQRVSSALDLSQFGYSADDVLSDLQMGLAARREESGATGAGGGGALFAQLDLFELPFLGGTPRPTVTTGLTAARSVARS